MAEIVVAVYDHYGPAKQALNELLSSGFSIEHVKLTPDEEHAAARQAALLRENKEETGITGTILGLIRSFLATPEDYRHTDIDADFYAEAVRRGSYVLAAETESAEQSTRAVEVMARHEPVDIDKRSAQWQAQGWSQYDATASVFNEDEIRQERSSYGTAQQKANACEDRAVPRAGIRIFQRAAEELAAGMDASARPATIHDTVRHIDGQADKASGAAENDDAFRRHWQSAYGPGGGRYEDYAAAYEHGSRRAADERHKNARWSDVEPEVRRDWESNNAGHPWERIKEAVRYGWEKLTRTE